MAANTIRQDVIKVEFDTDSSGIDALIKSLDKLKKYVTGDISDGIDELKESAKNLKASVSDVGNTDGFKKLKDDIDAADDGAERLKETADDVKKSVSGVGDTDGLGKTKEGLDKTNDGLRKTKDASKQVAAGIKTALKSAGDYTKNIANQINSAADTIASKVFNLKNLIAGIATGVIVKQSVDVVVDRQNITSQFEVLLGSAEEAQKRVEELTDFAGTTPFTRDEIFAASKQLQVFTGDALSTGDALRVIGDVAAGTGQPFEEVALWTGRMYDAMKSGRPFGEAAARLQEMGAISGEDRAKLEALAKTGGDMTTKWAEVENIFGRYNGTMEKLSNNLGNMLTSLKSFATNSIFLPIGQGITAGLQPAIQKFREFRKTNKADVEAMGEVLKKFAEKICVPLFDKIERGAEFVIKAIGALKNGVAGLQQLKGTSPLLDGFISILQFIIANKNTVISALQGIGIAMGGILVASKVNKMFSALQILKSPLGMISAIFVGLFMLFKQNGGTIQDLIGGFSKLSDWCKSHVGAIKKAAAAVGTLVVAFKGFQFVGGIASLFGKKPKGKSSGAFFDGITNVFEGIAKTKTSVILKGIAKISLILVSFTLLSHLLSAIAPQIGQLSVLAKLIGVILILGAVGAALAKLASLVGNIPVMQVIKGLANMVIVIGGLTAVVWIMNALLSGTTFDAAKMLTVAGLIGVLGVVGGVLAVFAGIVGAIPIPVVLMGLANIALVLVGITVVIEAFGLLSQIPGFNEFLEKGGQVLAKIFSIIGEMVGSLIGGVGVGITNALPQIGENLSAFAASLQPMFSMLSGVDLNGVGAFFAAFGGFMLQLAGEKILSQFTGGTNFSELGNQLSAFAVSSADFFNTVATMPAGGFENAKLLFDALSGIDSLPKDGGIAQWFTGTINWGALVNGLGLLASAQVIGFFNAISQIPQAAFENVKALFDALSCVNELPKDGGIAQWFTGTVDWDSFSEKLPPFGRAMAEFYASIASITDFEKIRLLFDALKSIDGAVPKEGGVFNAIGSFFTGDSASGLAALGNALNQFGQNAQGFFAQINALNLTNLNGLWESLKRPEEISAAALQSVNSNLDSIVAKVTQLPQQMGDGIRSAGNALADSLVCIWEQAARAMANPVNKVISGANWVLREFGSSKLLASWTPYAKGTFGHKGGNALLNDGRGAELVQMPNGKTFLPQGKNVFFPNAPKGMKVLPAEQTARLLGKQQPAYRYAGGAGEMSVSLPTYPPETSLPTSTTQRNSETNNYAPTFNITVNGSLTDRETIRQTKQKIFEMMDEYFDNLARRNKVIRQG